MSPVVGLSLDEAVEFTELEDGAYPVTISEFSEVKKGGKSSYITATLIIADGHERAGARCWQNLPINGRGAGIFVNFLNAATGDEMTVAQYKEDGLEVDTDDLIGSELTAIIKQEEYPEGSGTMRAQVKQILPAS